MNVGNKMNIYILELKKRINEVCATNYSSNIHEMEQK